MADGLPPIHFTTSARLSEWLLNLETAIEPQIDAEPEAITARRNFTREVRANSVRKSCVHTASTAVMRVHLRFPSEDVSHKQSGAWPWDGYAAQSARWQQTLIGWRREGFAPWRRTGVRRT
jgi:hypothetical protein